MTMADDIRALHALSECPKCGGALADNVRYMDKVGDMFQPRRDCTACGGVIFADEVGES